MSHVVCNRDFLWNFIVLYFLSSLSPGQQPTNQSMQNQPQLQSLGRMRKVEDRENQNEIQMRTEAICRKHMLPSHLKLLYSIMNLSTISLRALVVGKANKCWNIGPEGYKLASRIGWYPFFSALGPIQGHIIQHLLVTLYKS